ncbi:hypothetical protein GCM10010440_37670 [Kitasatospora cinereorecta]
MEPGRPYVLGADRDLPESGLLSGRRLVWTAPGHKRRLAFDDRTVPGGRDVGLEPTRG